MPSTIPSSTSATSEFHYLSPNPSSRTPTNQSLDILEILYDGIESHSYNYFKFFNALNVPKQGCLRRDFIKALVERFNLVQEMQQDGESEQRAMPLDPSVTKGNNMRPSSRASSRASSARLSQRSTSNRPQAPLPPHVASYQLQQLRRLEKLTEKTMNEPVTFRDFLQFFEELRKKVSMHKQSLYGRAGRFASTMNHPGYSGIKRVDRMRRLYGMDMEYSDELARPRQISSAYLSSDEDEEAPTGDARSRPSTSRAKRATKPLIPNGYGIAPFADDPNDDHKLVLSQKPVEKYKAYNSQPEYLEPREASQQMDAALRRHQEAGNRSSSSKDYRVRENRAHLMRTNRIKNHVNSREQKHLTNLFGPKMAQTLLQSKQDRERLQSRGLDRSSRRPKSAGSTTFSCKRRPNFSQPLNRHPRRDSSRPSSGKSSFSSIPKHLLNPKNPNMRLSQ
uniref:Uncharacterized protein n=1 Tax=Percolomonas cosmopolitus TaxID=63605 RepID=A0A7S1KU11_9EUKA